VRLNDGEEYIVTIVPVLLQTVKVEEGITIFHSLENLGYVLRIS
jgi:hypothetical protein